MPDRYSITRNPPRSITALHQESNPARCGRPQPLRYRRNYRSRVIRLEASTGDAQQGDHQNKAESADAPSRSQFGKRTEAGGRTHHDTHASPDECGRCAVEASADSETERADLTAKEQGEAGRRTDDIGDYCTPDTDRRDERHRKCDVHNQRHEVDAQ